MPYGRPAYAKHKRDASEDAIVRALEGIGALVLRCDGVPWDLVVQLRGRVFLGEVKSKGGRLTAAQQRAMLRGWRINVWRTPADALGTVTAE